MKAEIDSNAQWDACPDGALLEMADRLNAERRRRETLRLAAAGGIGAAAIAVAILTTGVLRSDHMKYGGITCAQCQSHFVPYHALKTGGESAFPIDGITTENMGMHLADCGICRGMFQAAYPGVLEVSAAGPRYSPPPLALLSRPPIY
ncbi:hypothetical protein OAS39_05680 [Pirellulales bacterium]|nr:hypothetical protein [Pirellulales bacterium]